MQGVESGRSVATIDRRFGFDEIIEAHRYLESNAQLGKVIVTLT